MLCYNMKKKHVAIIVVLVALALMLVLSFVMHPLEGPMPSWLSILPPIVAITMALLTREVLSSLFVGILTGTFIMSLYDGCVAGEAFGKGLLRVVDTYIIGALNEPDHIMIIVFTLLIGGMVRILSINGGMHGIVEWLSRKAKTPKSGQLAAYLMSFFIFFDDYANTLVVGNTMRPVTDKLHVSREKLAYIVDSSSAPMVSIAFITTWIGAELSYIQNGIDAIGLDVSPYSVFISSLGYSFYPLLTLLFIFIVILSGRDFGPMLKSERLAREKGFEETKVSADVPDKQSHMIDALLPLGVLIVGTIAGLVVTGYDKSIWSGDSSFFTKLSATIGNSNSYLALLWSSLVALITAIFITFLRGSYKFGKLMEETVEGFKLMFTAVVILTMAWSIALVTKDMHTADFVSQLLVKWSVVPEILPALTFVLAFFIGFSTGTSWGTMAILYPLVLPSIWMLSQSQGLEYDACMRLFNIVVATVLAGAVLGDHCSPISDTTIMSSTACSCNHILHVRTQMPYALVVGSVSLIVLIPVSFGMPSWIAFVMAIAGLYAIVRFVGKKV